MASEAIVIPEAIGRKYERDIDMLLAEEFATSPRFTNWFLGKTKKFKSLEGIVSEVYISKSDSMGESDLIVILLQPNGTRFALYIEDKINAPLQPQQEERYQIRAEEGASKGKYSDFEVILCAPEVYIASITGTELFDSLVSYESISSFLRSCDQQDVRLAYRARLLETAIPKSTTAWERIEDEITNAFWVAAYNIAHTEFLELNMKEQTVTKGQTWISFRTHDMPTMPQHIYIICKGGRGFMDLKAFFACVRLVRFYREHREQLIEAAAEARPMEVLGQR